jgi:hypothetical protein
MYLPQTVLENLDTALSIIQSTVPYSTFSYVS